MDDRPVALLEDHELGADLERLAAAAGCRLDLVRDGVALRSHWAGAPLVLLDEGGLKACLRAGLSRRDGVVLVARSAPAPEIWEQAVRLGVEHVAVLPEAEGWLVTALADAVEQAPAPGRVLAVLGGRGGAGASVLAVAVAVVAVGARRDVLLVDCDPLGGGLDLVVGAEEVDGLRWSGLRVAEGRVASSSLHAALPTAPVRPWGGDGPGRLTVLSCDREGPGPEGGAVHAVCGAGRRAGETVICDVPRYDCPAGSAALESADLAVLVVPAEVRACAAAAPIVERVRTTGTPLRLVVRGPAPGGLTAADVARTLDLPLLTAMRPQPGLCSALDRGQAPGQTRGPLVAAATTVLAALDVRTAAQRAVAA